MTMELDVDWATAAKALTLDGWVRLPGAVDGRSCARFLAAAPTPWIELESIEGRTVRQVGLHSGAYFDRASPEVQALGLAIVAGLDTHRNGDRPPPPPPPPVPDFNEVEWSRSADGVGYITAHRDPPAVGGVIAIVTLSGTTRFRLWPDDVDPRQDPDAPPPVEWDTGDGDLVLLRGTGWPHADARCLVHEVDSPASGERAVLTLRHNRGGADYFATNA